MCIPRRHSIAKSCTRGGGEQEACRKIKPGCCSIERLEACLSLRGEHSSVGELPRGSDRTDQKSQLVGQRVSAEAYLAPATAPPRKASPWCRVARSRSCAKAHWRCGRAGQGTNNADARSEEPMESRRLMSRQQRAQGGSSCWLAEGQKLRWVQSRGALTCDSIPKRLSSLMGRTFGSDILKCDVMVVLLDRMRMLAAKRADIAEVQCGSEKSFTTASVGGQSTQALP